MTKAVDTRRTMKIVMETALLRQIVLENVEGDLTWICVVFAGATTVHVSAARRRTHAILTYTQLSIAIGACILNQVVIVKATALVAVLIAWANAMATRKKISVGSAMATDSLAQQVSVVPKMWTVPAHAMG